MNRNVIRQAIHTALLVAVLLLQSAGNTEATIDGITGPAFNLSVSTGNITTPDGGSVHIWGYANGGGLAQYPGPTLIINQGDIVTVTLTNNLTVAGGGTPPNVSIPRDRGVTSSRRSFASRSITWSPRKSRRTA